MKKLCFIGGFPRAGTRQIADVMNQLEQVEIKGELYPRSFKAMTASFEQADEDHSGRWSQKGYARLRSRSILNALAGISK